MFAPASTPREIVQRMQKEVQGALALADVKQVLTAEGAELVGSTPEALGAQLKADIAKWAKVVQAAGVKAE
jgi:tripartite-type tricarboxylate transporter receptor subunit TctC